MKLNNLLQQLLLGLPRRQHNAIRDLATEKLEKVLERALKAGLLTVVIDRVKHKPTYIGRDCRGPTIWCLPEKAPEPLDAKPVLNVITPVSRPKNLPRIKESLALLRPYFDVRWILALDDKYANPADISVAADTIIVCPHEETKGDGQRNEAMKHIVEGWVYFLDDDNLIHPDFPKIAAHYVDHAAKKCLVFNQLHRDGSRRLNTTRVYLGEIDTASFLVHSSAIRNAYWRPCPSCPNGLAGDFSFVNDLWNQGPEEFFFSGAWCTYYNAI